LIGALLPNKGFGEPTSHVSPPLDADEDELRRKNVLWSRIMSGYEGQTSVTDDSRHVENFDWKGNRKLEQVDQVDMGAVASVTARMKVHVSADFSAMLFHRAHEEKRKMNSTPYPKGNRGP